jgi:hypothetical protein
LHPIADPDPKEIDLNPDAREPIPPDMLPYPVALLPQPPTTAEYIPAEQLDCPPRTDDQELVTVFN